MRRSLLDAVFRAVRGQMGALFVFSFLANLLLLVSSVYMMQIFDRVLASGSLDTLVWLTVAAIFAIAVYGVLEQVRRRLLVRIGAWLETELSTPVLAQCVTQRLRPESQGDGGLADVAEMRSFLGGDAVLAFLDAPWTPGFIAIIWFIHPTMGAIALAGACVLFIFALVNDRLTRGPQQAAMGRMRRAQADAGRYVESAETVAALGMTRPLLTRWRGAYMAAHDETVSIADVTAALFNLSRSLRLAIQVVIMGAGAFLVLRGQITSGAMIAASIVLSRALSPVERSISAWRGYVSFRQAQRNLTALFEAIGPAARTVVLPRPVGSLAAEAVSFTPPGAAEPILDGISFDLEKGEVCGIVGPSGSGKSSLCRLIVGVWHPTDGHVRLDGADVPGWNPDDLGPHIGYLPQRVDLFPGTVAENIARMRDVPDLEIIAAAKLADVHDMILRLPDGYNTDVGIHGGRLSGGQRQRIGLARALFGGPALIVLDEPNTGLDTDGDRALLETIGQMKESGRTVVIVTHQPSMLRSVDKVIALGDGRLHAFGPRDDVLRVMPRRRPFMRPGPVSATRTVGNAP
jgi:PrtD family type I secretion system ABC transporter